MHHYYKIDYYVHCTLNRTIRFAVGKCQEEENAMELWKISQKSVFSMKTIRVYVVKASFWPIFVKIKPKKKLASSIKKGNFFCCIPNLLTSLYTWFIFCCCWFCYEYETTTKITIAFSDSDWFWYPIEWKHFSPSTIHLLTHSFVPHFFLVFVSFALFKTLAASQPLTTHDAKI